MRLKVLITLVIMVAFVVLPGYGPMPAHGEAPSIGAVPAPELSETEQAAVALAKAILAPPAAAKPEEPDQGEKEGGADLNFLEALAKQQLEQMKQMMGGQLPPELAAKLAEAEKKVEEIAPPSEEEDQMATAPVQAVMEVLARAGIATVSRTDKLQVAVAPTLPINALDTEAYQLAQEARGGARLTLGQLGDMLQQVGWEVPLWIEPGQALADALALMIKEAQANPKLPHSFVPLFLQAMAQQRTPKIDLTGKVNPDWVPLSALEAQLLLAHHARGNESYPLEVGTGLGRWRSPAVAHAATPCSDMMDGLGDFKPFASLAADKIAGIPADAIYEKLGIPTIKLSHIGIALKLAKMVGMMVTDAVQFELVADDTAHYSHNAENPNEHGFKAVARVDVEKLKTPAGEFGSSLADCMSAAGYNMPNTFDAMMKAAKDYKVFWYPEGLKEHATFSPKNKFEYHIPVNGNKLIQAGDRFVAVVIVDMAEEQGDPCHTGPIGASEMRLRAELDMSQAIDPATLGKVVLGGFEAVPEALADVLMEWFKKWAPMQATSTVTVQWHKPVQWTGTITYRRHFEQSASETRPLSGGSVNTQTTNTADYEATINVNTNRPCGGNEKVTAKASFSNITTETGHGKSQCFDAKKNGATERSWSTSGNWVSKGSGTASPSTGAYVAFGISPTGEYSLTFGVPSVKADSSTSMSVQSQQACGGSDSAEDNTSFTEVIGGATVTLNGPIDPDAMALSGAKTWKEGDYTTVTATWNLTGSAGK